MKLIVGLGNPGDKYKFTRHNVGFLVIDLICQKLKITLDKEKTHGSYAKFEDFIIAKPNTYMNLSGNFVLELANFFKIAPDDILVIHDEKDFELGKSAIKIGGSGASHNGVLDVINKLNTQNFKRLKIGIGQNKEMALKDYVLQRFSLEEFSVLEPVLNQAADVCIQYSFNDIHYLMNKYNQKKKNGN
ncbi:aminoacyl-tRNA hydrolase [Mycoplasmopsis synoviae]|uniref:Peptidyl-tRNA hydrolase n=1 Tax=Mycoplasmopsis synoviae TaxID=2109 RepID=A0AAX3F014_MYCSY|nr:aminoacyl-tRNA hydrolase [Mycoplasmopsis synoviae]UZW64393.1 aminoacyl-tRNA hydrolase [Mycoplasmopsis synoviae]